MTRLVPVLCVACAAGIGLTAWSQLSAGTAAAVPTPVTDGAAGNATPATSPARAEPELAAELRKARRQCSMPALDAVVTRLEQAAASDGDSSATWHLLAEAYLERAQQRTHLRGIAVGEPVFAELPAEQTADLEAGLAAVAKARALGEDSGSLFRIEAGLMSQHITGLATALTWNGKIGKALAAAVERTADDAKVHVALGLRKLLAPRWFGHDPEAALKHFEFAAETDDDERAAVFAGMASYLQQKRQQAIAWLERAVEKNPDNRFARVVLRRLRRGEEDPFGRDVSEAEVAAAK